MADDERILLAAEPLRSQGEVTEHVQVTPLGMSAEQMRISNAEAVTAIEAKAAEAARNSERQRLAGLNAAFGTDPEFVADCVSKGLSVESAKAARFDVVSTQLAESKAENEKLVSENKDLKARIEKTKIGFVEEPADGETETKSKSIEARIDAAWGNVESGAYARFNGNKAAFVALMKHSPSKLDQFEQAT